MPRRVVLDSNEIIAAGTRWLLMPRQEPPSFPQRLLSAIAESHTGLFTGKIVGEYVEKLIDLGHPHARVQVFMGWLFGAFEQVQTTTRECNPAPVDPDDAVFLICALDGNADLLVTEDKHLLALHEHYNPPRIAKALAAGQELGVHP